MATVAKVIYYNKMIDRAIADRRYCTAQKYMLLLHKLEHKDRIAVGAYRLR